MIYERLRMDFFVFIKLGYLQDRNAAAHSVDSDLFYAVIYLSRAFQDLQ